ncbi:MAG: hypothetical protein J1G05_05055 [Clostridiales bacterium]|nr:hypothetical protein [Clostridiales bacterium]
MSDKILADIRARLNKLNIFEMRQIARYFGVSKPAESKKAQLIYEVLEIAQAKASPKAPSKVGAPPKSQSYDQELVADIETCRNYYLQIGDSLSSDSPRGHILSVGDGESAKRNLKQVKGILDKTDVFVLRDNGFSNPYGVFVHDSYVNRYGLKYGDMVCGIAQRNGESEGYGLTDVISVNGKQPDKNRKDFTSFTRIYPEKRVKVGHSGDTACRIIDLCAPLALGQRAFVTGLANSGKSTLLKQLIQGIKNNEPEILTITLLVGARPEEATDFKRTLGEENLFYTTFDMPDEEHVQAVRLVAEYAKRLCENGNNVVLAIDGLGNFVRALKFDRVEELKKLLFSACNAEEGPTLTIIAVLESEESVFGGVSALADMCVELSGELAKDRIFPAINIRGCFADRAETLLDDKEIKLVSRLRSLPDTQVIELFKQTSKNSELADKLLK